MIQFNVIYAFTIKGQLSTCQQSIISCDSIQHFISARSKKEFCPWENIDGNHLHLDDQQEIRRASTTCHGATLDCTDCVRFEQHINDLNVIYNNAVIYIYKKLVKLF